VDHLEVNSCVTTPVWQLLCHNSCIVWQFPCNNSSANDIDYVDDVDDGDEVDVDEVDIDVVDIYVMQM